MTERKAGSINGKYESTLCPVGDDTIRLLNCVLIFTLALRHCSTAALRLVTFSPVKTLQVCSKIFFLAWKVMSWKSV